MPPSFCIVLEILTLYLLGDRAFQTGWGNCTREISTVWSPKQDLQNDIAYMPSWWRKSHKDPPQVKNYRHPKGPKRGGISLLQGRSPDKLSNSKQLALHTYTQKHWQMDSTYTYKYICRCIYFPTDDKI